MKTTKEKPQSGEFIQVWRYNGMLCASSYKWEDDVLKWYEQSGGGIWNKCEGLSSGCTDIFYIIP